MRSVSVLSAIFALAACSDQSAGSTEDLAAEAAMIAIDNAGLESRLDDLEATVEDQAAEIEGLRSELEDARSEISQTELKLDNHTLFHGY